MRFFSVFDIVKNKANQLGYTETEMYAVLKNYNVNKKDLLAYKENGVIPTDKVLNGILSYLGMTKVELELKLGRIPAGLEDVFLNNTKEIAKILENKNSVKLNEFNSIQEIKPYFYTDLGKLYNGDCLELFKQVPDENVDTIFADPPFNLDKEYDEGVTDKNSFSGYLDWYYKWIDECIRVLKPGGSLFIYNIPKWNTYLSEYLNRKLNFRNWITVDMKFGLPIQNRLYPANYSLLYYVKGDKPKTFNVQRIPLQTCPHCGREIKDYGGYKNKMNPKGVTLSDVWSDIYPVRHSSSKNRKFNELSVKLLDRIITMSTNEGDVVLDPFGGSGTTFAVSEMLGRKWIGFELGNCEIIKERLKNKDKDKKLLGKVYEEKNKLFPNRVKELRKKNGLWIDDDFRQDHEGNSKGDKKNENNDQISLSLE
ncbi:MULTISPECIES: DNA-methyltransferase [Bacillus]|uniref:Type II methyltransferase M.BamHI n=3 Tax=Bacillus amyloliquefaciens TaxID=1390 RepID=MTB1_BACAM|nr:site-specific DNA-methyltransferase [Bacillus amyloliquefaciens]P23941.3 RecName: Full=Type II methyltransferase M.BamHI; Short=M.BamHI; AltName: Full=Modification methylase BamHI; AltName: Full=N(4)- cytosine-specific methyltransferase BamHI [Bacillus amyloliquefaciens]AIW35137.1 modification methylase [Bacillus subtilis]AEB25484.1 Modification methylase BamHI; M.BamHI; N [Bacillus amyloliquefaciens TA208]AEB64943.1 Modification methylase BamHI; M.BamHI; N [Bacillus amyloliquefaciens LL3]A